MDADKFLEACICEILEWFDRNKRSEKPLYLVTPLYIQIYEKIIQPYQQKSQQIFQQKMFCEKMCGIFSHQFEIDGRKLKLMQKCHNFHGAIHKENEHCIQGKHKCILHDVTNPLKPISIPFNEIQSSPTIVANSQSVLESVPETKSVPQSEPTIVTNSQSEPKIVTDPQPESTIVTDSQLVLESVPETNTVTQSVTQSEQRFFTIQRNPDNILNHVITEKIFRSISEKVSMHVTENGRSLILTLDSDDSDDEEQTRRKSRRTEI